MSAKLVETGTFKIDRKRTLKKLRDYQLPAGPAGFLSWIRTASASGAKSLAIETTRSSIQLEFDGTLFNHKDLEDPYHALFSREGGRGERNRHFALALLWAWRAGVESVTIRSGEGENRLQLMCESVMKETLEVAEHAPMLHKPPETSTLVMMTWSRGRYLSPLVKGLDRVFLAEACALLDAHLSYNGEPLKSLTDEAWPPYSFRKDKVHGTLSIPRHDSKKSVVALYVHGAYAADISVRDSDFPFRGRLNDNTFKLNASLTKVVQDKRLSSALSMLKGRYTDFIFHSAKEQIKTAKDVGLMLAESSRLREEWKRVFDFDSTNDKPPGPARLPWHLPHSKRMRVHMAARVAAWLRMMTETMTHGYSRLPNTELERMVWRVPLIFDVRGRPITLERLNREDKGPRIRFSSIRRRVYTRPDWIVWAMTRRDELWLRRVANRSVVNVTKLPERAW